MKRLLFGELLLVLITIVFIYLKPISRIYVADYLEKISFFLFRSVSDEDLNEWYERSFELLRSKGLKPKSLGNSWLSQIYRQVVKGQWL